MSIKKYKLTNNLFVFIEKSTTETTDIKIEHIGIKNKTATEVAAEYGFNESQIFQLNELIQTNNESLWEDVV